jgi:hypothetical protein
LYGQLRSSEWGAYAYFSFLSQDTLVIPNLIHNTLEIVKIVIKSDDIPCLVPLCVLSLPPLTRRASIIRLGCRAEPNPTGPGPLANPAPSDRPFRDKAEDAIILFSVLIEDVQIHPGQFHFPQTRPFSFIVHRRALLDHIPVAHRACAPFCSTPEPAPETVQVPWEAWGSSATRWFEGDPASMRWITTTAGQRAVTMEDRASTPIIVRDFNPYAVCSARARAAASAYLQQRCDWSEDLPNGNVMTLKVDDSVLAAGSVFKDDVRSSLPYVEVVTRAEYRYEGILIDEERILGLKVCPRIVLRVVSGLLVIKFSFSYRLAKKTSLGFRPLTFISWVSLPKSVMITVVRMWSKELVFRRTMQYSTCSIVGFRVLGSYPISLQPCVCHLFTCTTTFFFMTPLFL